MDDRVRTNRIELDSIAETRSASLIFTLSGFFHSSQKYVLELGTPRETFLNTLWKKKYEKARRFTLPKENVFSKMLKRPHSLHTNYENNYPLFIFRSRSTFFFVLRDKTKWNFAMRERCRPSCLPLQKPTYNEIVGTKNVLLFLAENGRNRTISLTSLYREPEANGDCRDRGTKHQNQSTERGNATNISRRGKSRKAPKWSNFLSFNRPHLTYSPRSNRQFSRLFFVPFDDNISSKLTWNQTVLDQTIRLEVRPKDNRPNRLCDVCETTKNYELHSASLSSNIGSQFCDCFAKNFVLISIHLSFLTPIILM